MVGAEFTDRSLGPILGQGSGNYEKCIHRPMAMLSQGLQWYDRPTVTLGGLQDVKIPELIRNGKN